MYRGKDKQWHFADSGMKNRNQDVTITLPRGKEHYRFVHLKIKIDNESVIKLHKLQLDG